MLKAGIDADSDFYLFFGAKNSQKGAKTRIKKILRAVLGKPSF